MHLIIIYDEILGRVTPTPVRRGTCSCGIPAVQRALHRQILHHDRRKRKWMIVSRLDGATLIQTVVSTTMD